MRSARNAALFLLLAALWGTSFVAIKAGLAYLPPVLFAAVRYDLAGVLVLGYAAVATEYWLPRDRADWLSVGIGATLVIGLYNAFLFVGQQHVTSGVAAILIATNPIWATGFSRLALPEERLTPVGGAGLLLGLAGVALVVRPSRSALLASDVVASGLVLLAAVCVALGSVLIQRVGADVSNEGLVGWSTVLGALLLHALGFGLPTESLADLDASFWAVVAVAYLAVFASALGYVVYFDLLDRVGAIEINLVSYAVPVVAAVAGALVLGESLDGVAVLGFCLIFVGFLVIKRTAIRAELTRLRS